MEDTMQYIEMLQSKQVWIIYLAGLALILLILFLLNRRSHGFFFWVSMALIVCALLFLNFDKVALIFLEDGETTLEAVKLVASPILNKAAYLLLAGAAAALVLFIVIKVLARKARKRKQAAGN